MVAVTPLEEHAALVAAVTEMLRVAEAAMAEPVDMSPWSAAYYETGDEWWVRQPNGGTVALCGEDYTAAPNHAAHIAAHDPPWAIRSHRDALERLNQHRPCDCDEIYATHCYECMAPVSLCHELPGLRSVYMKKEQGKQWTE